MENTKKKAGQFQAYELKGFRLHVYNSNDVMADTSFIIEGEKGLVVMEYPLFKVNAAEFGDYIKALGKPIVTDITDYHLGGSDQLPIVMPEGMPAFIEVSPSRLGTLWSICRRKKPWRFLLAARKAMLALTSVSSTARQATSQVPASSLADRYFTAIGPTTPPT